MPGAFPWSRTWTSIAPGSSARSMPSAPRLRLLNALHSRHTRRAHGRGKWFHGGGMSLAAVTDADLVVRCRSGEQEAWNELVNRFSRYVYAIATRIYRLDKHDAEDVFQEVFARTYEN